MCDTENCEQHGTYPIWNVYGIGKIVCRRCMEELTAVYDWRLDNGPDRSTTDDRGSK